MFVTKKQMVPFHFKSHRILLPNSLLLYLAGELMGSKQKKKMTMYWLEVLCESKRKENGTLHCEISLAYCSLVELGSARS